MLLDYKQKPAEGFFKIESVDRWGNTIDKFESSNLIMDTARVSMAECFANLNTSIFAHRIVLGTGGCVDQSLVDVKVEEHGFVKERDRLFSEYPDKVFKEGEILSNILKGDVLKYQDKNSVDGFYEYIDENQTGYVLYDDILTSSSSWKFLEVDPYSFTLDFMLPKNNNNDQGTPATVTNSQNSQVSVLQSDSSVTFFIDISAIEGNTQHEDHTAFNEAALYVNGRIFAMKNFRSKVKDNTVVLKITWTITF